MRLWITCSLILLMVLASLSTAATMTFPIISTTIILPALCLITVILTIELVLQRIIYNHDIHNHDIHNHNSHDIHAHTFDSHAFHRVLSLTPLPILFLQAIIIFLLIFGTGLHTVRAVQIEVSNQLEQPLRVLASVRPIGISDSYYYPAANMGYRQLAVIESVEPLTLNHFKSLPPPFYAKESKNANTLDSLQGKTVLLSARLPSLPKKTKLSTGYSTDFSGLNEFQPTQSTQMMLELSPIPSADLTNRSDGFVHRWLRSRHVNAQATVLAYQRNFFDSPNDKNNWRTTLNQWRWNIRSYFLYREGERWQNASVNKQQALAVTLSLLTGDRALINKETKNLYQLSGISHLLAISGTHVLFLAIILSGLVVRLVNQFAPQLYSRFPRSQLRWITMVVGALLYALFTGFDVPSARTVYMLMAVGLARLLLLDIPPRQVLLVIAVLMAVKDPYVLWQAGFWLSFVAVMLLISYDLSMSKNNFQLHNPTDNHASFEEKQPSLLAQFLPFLKLQLWMFIALLPLSLLLFGKVSLWGVLVNLFAIGFYGWVIVPLNLLAGVVYLLLPSVANILWGLVSWLLQFFHGFLVWLIGVDELGQGGQAWLYTDINAGIMLIMGLLCLPMLLPRNTLSRMWSLPPMVLLVIVLFNQSDRQLKKGESSATTVTLLNTKFTGNQRNISSLLITHDDENWLVVANHSFGFEKERNQKKSNEKRVSSKEQKNKVLKQWQNELGESGVSALTGIIIQTPSPELLQASLSLQKLMPVGFLWQAGNKHINRHSHAVSSCNMGKQWQSDDGNLSIKAITGWQEIDDTGVWSCAISVESIVRDAVIQINTQYPVHWADEQSNYLLSIGNSSKMSLPTVNRVIINAGSRKDTLWQLWALLCSAEYMNSSAVQRERGSSLLLSHSYNDFPNELVKQNKAMKNWILLDKPNQYNQQKLPSILLDWSNEVKADK